MHAWATYDNASRERTRSAEKKAGRLQANNELTFVRLQMTSRCATGGMLGRFTASDRAAIEIAVVAVQQS